jgi:hypothetical protein
MVLYIVLCSRGRSKFLFRAKATWQKLSGDHWNKFENCSGAPAEHLVIKNISLGFYASSSEQ